jgi:hypothetical protein
MGWDDTYKWLLAWAVALVILTLLNKTRLGHVFIYYWLWSLIVFLFVTQYKFIIGALKPLGTSSSGALSSNASQGLGQF